MPTYKNGSTTKNPQHLTIAFNGETWRWGEVKPVPFFVPDEKGLVKLSDAPSVAAVCLAAGELSLVGGESREVYVPECAVFLASFICASGSVRIQRNYRTDIATPLTGGLAYIQEMSRKLVERFIVVCVDDAIVTYNIERVIG